MSLFLMQVVNFCSTILKWSLLKVFKIGDLVTLARSNGKIIGYVTSVVDKTFVWVMWFSNDKSVVYSYTSLVKYVSNR